MERRAWSEKRLLSSSLFCQVLCFVSLTDKAGHNNADMVNRWILSKEQNQAV
jgi:hypothetical protein